MQGLATDLEPMGVAVANLHPGWVRTDMGGAAADIDPATSAGGILRIAEGLTLEGTGRFYNWDGSELAW
jgi:NAD(P)-dependent dehydrogenase (short-subunit alcohol dehydrogenase family)